MRCLIALWKGCVAQARARAQDSEHGLGYGRIENNKEYQEGGFKNTSQLYVDN
jgi:hypothetical protein